MKLRDLSRYTTQIKMITIRNGKKKAEWLKKKCLFHRIGNNVFYQSTILPAEPFLVSLHDNVIISAGVRLITHSVAHGVFNVEDGNNNCVTNFDKIIIEDNVYIGANVIVQYGVRIGHNSIVAAGAIVTRDVPPGSVVAGVPAKVIGSYDDVKQRTLERSKPYIDAGLDGRYQVASLIEAVPIEFDD